MEATGLACNPAGHGLFGLSRSENLVPGRSAPQSPVDLGQNHNAATLTAIYSGPVTVVVLADGT